METKARNSLVQKLTNVQMFPAVFRIRKIFYADPDPGSRKCPYGSGSGGRGLKTFLTKSTRKIEKKLYLQFSLLV